MDEKLPYEPEMPSPFEGVSPQTRFSGAIEAVIGFVSFFAHLGWIILILIIISSVFMRYIMGNSIVALEELQWHIYGAGFMLGLSYALVHDEHVRVDVLASGWRARTRAVIEIAAMLALVIPFSLTLAYFSLSFVQFSYNLNEISGSPGGLTHRWVIKSFMPFSLLLLALAALARAWKMYVFLRAREAT